MGKYVLNTFVLPLPDNDGQAFFKVRRVEFEEAMEWLKENADEFLSAVAIETTANLLTEWSGIHVPYSKRPVFFAVGDEALVARIKYVRKKNALKEHKITKNDFEPNDFEFLIVERFA